MLRLADVNVVFDNFESEHLIGEWQVDFDKADGLGSEKSLTDHLAKSYAKQGKKIMYLSVWPSEALAV